MQSGGVIATQACSNFTCEAGAGIETSYIHWTIFITDVLMLAASPTSFNLVQHKSTCSTPFFKTRFSESHGYHSNLLSLMCRLCTFLALMYCLRLSQHAPPTPGVWTWRGEGLLQECPGRSLQKDHRRHHVRQQDLLGGSQDDMQKELGGQGGSLPENGGKKRRGEKRVCRGHSHHSHGFPGAFFLVINLPCNSGFLNL